MRICFASPAMRTNSSLKGKNMCGIVAIHSKQGEIGIAQIERATNALDHRGPDGKGIYLNSSKSVALGHTRLAIMDVAGGNQPLFNENRSLTLVANGESMTLRRSGLISSRSVIISAHIQIARLPYTYTKNLDLNSSRNSEVSLLSFYMMR